MVSGRWLLHRFGLCLMLTCAMGASTFGQPTPSVVGGDDPWNRIEQLPAGRLAADVWIRAQEFQPVELNHANLHRLLAAAPNELSQRPGQITSGNYKPTNIDTTTDSMAIATDSFQLTVNPVNHSLVLERRERVRGLHPPQNPLV